MQRASSQLSNVRFYLQGLPCRPDNLTIDELLSRWRGQYDVLEARHGYIQWLFPLQQQGVNPLASPLSRQEITTLSASREARHTMLSALDMMLDFYGMRWQDQKLRQLARTSNYKERYSNLLDNGHNFLRISRILQSLCLFGLGSYTTPIVLYFLAEISAKELVSAGLNRSLQSFWIDCLPEGDQALTRVLAKRVLQGDLSLTPATYVDMLRKLQLRRQSTM